MKRVTSLSLILASVVLAAQSVLATFSIIAVDTVTGTVGGAGASCIAGAQIITDVVPGLGGVHTQAWYVAANQDYAHDLLLSHLTPDSILALLYDNDNWPELRQYGIVTFAGPGTSAAFTGNQTDDWKGHLTGPGYAIQGNILLGPEVIDDMETAFLTTEGPMEAKLMAALEAAKRPGADTRCMVYNKSAISAFIRVGHVGDGSTPYLYQVVNNTPPAVEPIDVLWEQFNAWTLTQQADSDSSNAMVEPDVLLADGLSSAVITIVPLNNLGAPPQWPVTVTVTNLGGGSHSPVVDNGDSTFSATIMSANEPGYDTIVVSVEAYGATVELTMRPILQYYACGDIDNSLGDPNVADLTYLVDYLFRSGPAPLVPEAGDVDSSGGIDVADITYLVDYLFRGGPAPQCQ